MTNLQFVKHYGHLYKGLSFYNCIFDEAMERNAQKNGREAWLVRRRGNRLPGLCMKKFKKTKNDRPTDKELDV